MYSKRLDGQGVTATNDHSRSLLPQKGGAGALPFLLSWQEIEGVPGKWLLFFLLKKRWEKITG